MVNKIEGISVEDFLSQLDPSLRKRLSNATDVEVTNYSLDLVKGIKENQTQIDELITNSLQNWTFDRIPRVDRNILRIAIFEILWVAEVDLKIACDEAVELAKSLSTDESSNYINGVLGRIVKLKDSIAI